MHQQRSRPAVVVLYEARAVWKMDPAEFVQGLLALGHPAFTRSTL